MPLPGATVTARSGDQIAAVTSTDLDGTYVLAIAPGAYTLRVQLAAFATADRDVTLGQPPCEIAADMKLLLASRTPGYVPPPPVPAAGSTQAGGPPSIASATGQAPVSPAADGSQAAVAGRGRGQGGRGGGRGGAQ